MKNLNPRSMISKGNFSRKGYKSLPNEGIDHFYEIDNKGNIAFYLVCDGIKSLDWILEDLTYVFKLEDNSISFEIIVGSKSIAFLFLLEEPESLYSATKIATQPNVMLYYLMESKENYIYLGYNEINISSKIKEEILKNINCKLSFSEI